MTHAIIASMLVLQNLSPEPSSHASDVGAWEDADADTDNGTGSWLALTQGELIRSGDLRIHVSVTGDSVLLDAKWCF